MATDVTKLTPREIPENERKQMVIDILSGKAERSDDGIRYWHQTEYKDSSGYTAYSRVLHNDTGPAEILDNGSYRYMHYGFPVTPDVFYKALEKSKKKAKTKKIKKAGPTQKS